MAHVLRLKARVIVVRISFDIVAFECALGMRCKTLVPMNDSEF